MKCVRCSTEADALFKGGLCVPCWKQAPEPKDIRMAANFERQPPEHITPPAAFRNLSQPRRQALRYAHAGNWLAFFSASLRAESPLAPDIAAKRAAASADSALAVLLDRIPQLARPTDEPINPIQQ